MPIFEYKCRACGEESEILVMPHESGPPECPACHGRDLEQLLSAFSVNSQEKSNASWKSERSKYERTTLRDKKVAEAESVQHHLKDGH